MVTVTRKFRDDFDAWAGHRLSSGQWTAEDIDGLKELLRQDLTPGPDQLRAGVSILIAAGVEVTATIDDPEERYRLWADFFAAEAEAIRCLNAGAVRR